MIRCGMRRVLILLRTRLVGGSVMMRMTVVTVRMLGVREHVLSLLPKSAGHTGLTGVDVVVLREVNGKEKLLEHEAEARDGCADRVLRSRSRSRLQHGVVSLHAPAED